MLPLHAKDADNIERERDRPLDPEAVQEAQALVAHYSITIRGNSCDGYEGIVTELPSVMGLGASKEAALDATRELLKWTLAYLIETGRRPTLVNPVVVAETEQR